MSREPALVARCLEVREALREAQTGAERVRQIVADLKMLARSQPDAVGVTQLAEVIDAAASIARSEVRQRARLVLVGPAGGAVLPLVGGAPGRLGQVVLNLLINAAHAIAEGAPEQNEIRVTTRLEPGAPFVLLELSDTGVGIASQDLARIFDPFFTTKPLGQGTGLGLSISLGIVRALGGELTVVSERGRGTTFTMRLPIAVEGPAAGPSAG